MFCFKKKSVKKQSMKTTNLSQDTRVVNDDHEIESKFVFDYLNTIGKLFVFLLFCSNSFIGWLIHNYWKNMSIATSWNLLSNHFSHKIVILKWNVINSQLVAMVRERSVYMDIFNILNFVFFFSLNFSTIFYGPLSAMCLCNYYY